MSGPPEAASDLRVLVVVGPTATGKSALAARLGERLGGEVVSADSVQIYRRFDIGSGKPTPMERALCPHHLLDIADAKEPIDASRFAHLADAAILDIAQRGQLPIVCGGTFLWVRALIQGLVEAPAGDDALRRHHAELVQREGRSALHARLSEVDPEAAARLHPNDFVRVSRALEVHELTGKKLSQLQAAHGFARDRYRATYLGIDWPRGLYDERISARVRQMIDAGFVDEVRALVLDGYAETRAMDSVGYRQVKDAVLGGDWEEERLVEDIVRVTRIFARRQRTWLRDRNVRWLPPSALAEGFDALTRELRNELQSASEASSKSRKLSG